MGLQYEADPRQVEKLLEEFELDDQCNSAATPGLKALAEQLQEETELVGPELTRLSAVA